ncbi:MAG: hypothetical protein CME63_15755 [Halobacteriovoraceae bacterium]|nr:hypothetical protein [Halobacteriovoraceae bacterium]|tara:strand:- start:168600 stop:170672 length:2073 start_codon:yes stop_codon:yes gene_type:complete
METTTSFKDFNLNDALLNSLDTIGFAMASPIQELTIKPILEGKDIFAQAETGSGKTGSFAIPIIEQILRDEDGTPAEEKLVQYVVLSPTRELAQQTHKVFNQLGTELGINAACLIGGESIDKQKEILGKGTRILVATPGRLVDLIKQKAVKLDQVKSVVFDEADRLFDMGFQKDIEFILSKVSDDRQLIMVSATSNMEVLKTAYKFKSHPLELKLNEDSLVVDHIDHKLAMVTQKEKMPLLVNTLRQHEDVYAIVFCNTQLQTHLVAEWLRLMDFKAKPISGKLPQNKRTRLMEEFRNKDVTILVCTDVAARGLDIKDVNLVINYDLPQEAANYVHRIGRTGRAGAQGRAISFCAHEDCENLDDIYEFLETKIEKMDIKDEDVTAELPPKPYIDGKTMRPTERKSNQDRSKGKGRDQKSKSRDSKPKQEFEAPKERAFPTPLKRFVPSEDKKGDRRSFVITTDNTDDADRMALGYFMINDESLLKREVLKKGRKRFFLFGARRNTYRYTLDAHYKKLILPFLIEILTLSHINVMAKVGLKGDTVEISFNGPDEGLLMRNRGQMLDGLEQILRLYLANKITIPPKLRWNITVKSKRNNDRNRNAKNSRGPQKDRSRTSKSREEQNAKREKEVIKMVEEIKTQVLEKKEAIIMKPLDPRDRRTVHQFISEDDKFQTKSIGEGRLKKIEVSLK